MSLTKESMDQLYGQIELIKKTLSADVIFNIINDYDPDLIPKDKEKEFKKALRQVATEIRWTLLPTLSDQSEKLIYMYAEAFESAAALATESFCELDFKIKNMIEIRRSLKKLQGLDSIKKCPDNFIGFMETEYFGI